MKLLKTVVLLALLGITFSCDDDDTPSANSNLVSTEVNFQYKTTINVGGLGASEISAYDPSTKKIFIVNVESQQLSVFDISDLNNPKQETPIALSTYGSPNSVAVFDGKLAVAVEAITKQNAGKILLYDTKNNSLLNEFTVGALPDMVTFSKDGKLLISANEGEPNDDYTVDPNGSISIIDIAKNMVTTLDFTSFENQKAALMSKGFRIFGKNASFAQDIEPEFVTVSEDSKTAWVSLQENNGIAKVNLVSKTIEAIYPLGYKDFNMPGNELDASDKDDAKTLKKWPIKGIYMPDGITSISINGSNYVISANEGDSRDYKGFSEEERIGKLTLDAQKFPASFDYQNNINLGRLKITTTMGDTDNDGDYDELYTYGARSFSVWSGSGNLIYDSGNSIAKETLALTTPIFNDNDDRSDDKGGEPESVEILNLNNQRYILFVGLERNDQVLMYDITNPASPQFLNILSHSGDEAPEGLFVIKASESPTGKDLLVVSNEDSGTVSFYENN